MITSSLSVSAMVQIPLSEKKGDYKILVGCRCLTLCMRRKPSSTEPSHQSSQVLMSSWFWVLRWGTLLTDCPRTHAQISSPWDNVMTGSRSQVSPCHKLSLYCWDLLLLHTLSLPPGYDYVSPEVTGEKLVLEDGRYSSADWRVPLHCYCVHQLSEQLDWTIKYKG